MAARIIGLDVSHPIAEHAADLEDFSKKLSKFSDLFHNYSYIGRGAFGKVYRANKKGTEDCYAIKMIPEPNVDQKNEKRFLDREVKVLKKLCHQNVVRLHSVWTETVDDEVLFLLKLGLKLDDNDQEQQRKYLSFESDDSEQHIRHSTADSESLASAVAVPDEHTKVRASAAGTVVDRTVAHPSAIKVTHGPTVPVGPVVQPRIDVQRFYFIQMEFCFQTLKKWMADHVSINDRIDIPDIFAQILTGVSYIHSKGLVHRDLKPDNIFMSESKVVKIGDFGLVAGMLEEEKKNLEKDASSSIMSIERSELMTKIYHSYAAPEIKGGSHYSSKSDMYSVGLILFELLYPMITASERNDKFTKIKASYKELEKLISIEDAQVVANLISEKDTERHGSDEYLYWMKKIGPELLNTGVVGEATICPDFMSARCTGAVVAARNFNIKLKGAMDERLRANQSMLTFIDNDDNVYIMKMIPNPDRKFDNLMLNHDEYQHASEQIQIFVAPYKEGVLLLECNKISVQYSDYEFGLSTVLTKMTKYHLGHTRKWDSKSIKVEIPFEVNDVETKGNTIFLLSKNLARPPSLRKDDNILVGHINVEEVSLNAIITEKNVGRFSLCQDESRNLIATIHGNNRKIPDGEEKCVKVWKIADDMLSCDLLWSVSFNKPICSLICIFQQQSLLLALARESISPDITGVVPLKYPSEIWELELQNREPKLVGKVDENIDSLATIQNMLFFNMGNRFYVGKKVRENEIPPGLRLTTSDVTETQQILRVTCH